MEGEYKHGVQVGVWTNYLEPALTEGSDKNERGRQGNS